LDRQQLQARVPGVRPHPASEAGRRGGEDGGSPRITHFEYVVPDPNRLQAAAGGRPPLQMENREFRSNSETGRNRNGQQNKKRHSQRRLQSASAQGRGGAAEGNDEDTGESEVGASLAREQNQVGQDCGHLGLDEWRGDGQSARLPVGATRTLREIHAAYFSCLNGVIF